MIVDQPFGSLFEQSAAIMARLRGPAGCPWDRRQTPSTIRKYTLEETYEVLDAIEREDWPHLAEELGDLLLQVLFYAQMASEAGHFTLADVVGSLNRKLIRRHPHVFGEAASAEAGNTASALAPVAGRGSSGADAVVANWHSIKEMERKADPGDARFSGSLANVLRAQTALSEAAKLGSAAARVGFDWPEAQGVIAKLREEIDEVEAELALPVTPGGDGHLGEEVGDLLFTAANLARHLKLDAETTLRDANAKFRRRFEAMEQAGSVRLDQLTADELEQAWQAAKVRERAVASASEVAR